MMVPRLGLALVFALLASLPAHAQATSGTAARPASPATASVSRILYGEPASPAQAAIRDKYRARGLLESFAALFKPFRLPQPIGFRLASCDGESNAWYEPDDGMITVCYEYIEELQKNAPKTTTPDGITPDDAVAGPLIEVFLHESGHAIFERLQLPILGREEDAADQFAAFMMLQLGNDIALRAIRGTALMYALEAKTTTFGMHVFSDEHSLPAQRLFNMLCMAYGAKPKLFTRIVQKGYLPKDRAESCENEYAQVGHALKTLLSPHVEPEALARFNAGQITWQPRSKR